MSALWDGDVPVKVEAPPAPPPPTKDDSPDDDWDMPDAPYVPPTTEKVPLRAPFPYFGGKSTTAEMTWARFGNVANYIEPFCGSAANLLLRPHVGQMETINDFDCYLANFWRATKFAADQVVEYCDWPVLEADLHARHKWLVLSDDAVQFRERIKTDPDYFDAKIAGWWVWGQSLWIGGGWCPNQEVGSFTGNSINGKRPTLNGTGVHAGPMYRDCDSRRTYLLEWFRTLQNRLRSVRVCCGSWIRVCKSSSVTTLMGITGIFFDPPYLFEVDGEYNRNGMIYSSEDAQVAHAVREYCLERGNDPMMRIALCGLDGEHNLLEQHGWESVPWKAKGGYGGNSNENAYKERIWFSPHCLTPEKTTLW